MIKLFEKFTNIKEVKDSIFLRAVETDELDIVKFFVKKGYDINAEDVLYKATNDDDVFRFLLKNGANVKVLNSDYDSTRTLKEDVDVQKALIDFGHEVFIYDTVGFNEKLKEDPKYADIVSRFENVSKYNI